MQTSVLCLALLMVASVVTARPPSFDDTLIQQDDTTPLASVTPCRPSGGGDGASAEEGADALSDAFQQVAQGLLRVQEALRLKEQEAERRAQVALALLVQRGAAALREVVRQMEQEREEAIRTLRGEFSSRIQTMEERMNLVEGKLISSPTTARDSAVGVQVHELEKRVIKLEVNDKRAIEQVFLSMEVLLERYSPDGAPSDIPSAPTGPFSSTSTPTVTSTSSSSDNPFTTLPTSFSSFTTSTSTFSPTASPSTSPQPPTVSAPGATATGGEETDATQEGDAAEEQREEERVEPRIREVEAIRDRARAAPLTVGEELCDAALNGRLDDVRRLLDSGADVNYTNSLGTTALNRAVVSNKGDVVSLLLEKGANVNAMDMWGWSPLHYASYYDGSGRIVALLIAAGADVVARALNGATPLHFAAFRNNEAAVRALLAAGANKSLKGWGEIWKNKTPFDAPLSPDIQTFLRL